MAIREGKWDCPQCGFVGNRGSETKCKQCKKQRSDDVEFYVDEAAAEVSDDKLLEQANAGADWLCEFCQGSNPAALKACKSCGSPRGEKKREEKVTLDQPPAPLPPPKKPSSKLPWILGFVALFGACFVCLHGSKKDMTVEKVAWERTVALEKMATVTETGWQDELPAGARVKSTERKWHHDDHIQIGTKDVQKEVTEKVQTGTKKVKVGTKNKGNGFFEDVYENKPVYEERTRTVTKKEPVYRDDPVYKTWCTYDIDKWVTDHVEKAAGTDKKPAWPEFAKAQGLREGKKAEVYSAVFKDPKGKTYEWKPEFEKWKKLEVGKSYPMRVSMGSIDDFAE